MRALASDKLMHMDYVLLLFHISLLVTSAGNAWSNVLASDKPCVCGLKVEMALLPES